MQPTPLVSDISKQFEQMHITAQSKQPKELPHFGALRAERGKQKKQALPQPTNNAATAKPLPTRQISVVTNTPPQPSVVTSPSHRRANSSSSDLPPIRQPINFAAREPSLHAFKPVQQTSPTHGFLPPIKNSAHISPSSISSPSPSPLSATSIESLTNTVIIPRRTFETTSNKTNTVINRVVPSHSDSGSGDIVEPTTASQTNTVKGPLHVRRSSLGNTQQLPNVVSPSHSRSGSAHIVDPKIITVVGPMHMQRSSLSDLSQLPPLPLPRRNSTVTITNSSLAVPTHTRRPSGDNLSRATDTTTASTGSVDSTGSTGSDLDRRHLPHLEITPSFEEEDLNYARHNNAKAIRGRTASLSNVKLPKKADEWRIEQRAKIDLELENRKKSDTKDLFGLKKEDSAFPLSEQLAKLDAEIERDRELEYAKIEKRLQTGVAKKQKELRHDERLELKKLRERTEQQRIEILKARKNTIEKQLEQVTRDASTNQNNRILTLKNEVQTLKQRIEIRDQEIARLKSKQKSVFNFLPHSPRNSNK